MDDGEFAWDDAKAAINLIRHGVTFEMARAVFLDAFAIEWIDEFQDRSEPRFIMLGMVESRVLFVAYAMSGTVTRIISARLAEAHERRRYHDENRT